MGRGEKYMYVHAYCSQFVTIGISFHEFREGVENERKGIVGGGSIWGHGHWVWQIMPMGGYFSPLKETLTVVISCGSPPPSSQVPCHSLPMS